MEKTGVLFLNNAPFIGGAQVTLRAIIERLDRSRFRPFLALPANRAEMVAYFESAGAPVSLVPMPALNPPNIMLVPAALKTVTSLRSLVKRERIDIIHTNTQRGGPFGISLKWTTGAKFIWTVNDIGLFGPVRALTPLADVVTCVSRSMYSSLRPWQRRRARVIYNGVVVERRPADLVAVDRRSLRRELGVPEDAIVVGNVARLDQWKGVHVLVEAMHAVMTTRPDVWLVQIGNETPTQAAYAAQLRAAVERLPGGRGVLAGFRSDVQRWYSTFDLFAHSPLVTPDGHTEAFGMSVAEAMGHGLPVVATAVGGLREVVEDGVTGLLVPPEQPAALAKAIGTLLNDATRRAEMGHRGARRQQDLFSQEEEVRAFERLYLEVSSGARSQ